MGSCRVHQARTGSQADCGVHYTKHEVFEGRFDPVAFRHCDFRVLNDWQAAAGRIWRPWTLFETLWQVRGVSECCEAEGET